MYPVNNNVAIYNINLNENILSICNYITSRLKDLKNYMLQLVKKDIKQYFEDYHVHYNQLQKILMKHDEFKNEDFALYKANELIEYTFKNRKLTPELVDFIYQVWNTYINLLNSKLHLLYDHTISSKRYENNYSKYLEDIGDYEIFFYHNIYQRTGEYRDFSRKIGNILMKIV